METLSSFSRRRLLAAGAAGVVVTAASGANAATFGNPDQPAEGSVNVTNPKGANRPGAAGPEPCRQRGRFPKPAGNRCQRHAAVLVLIQSCS
jgi:oxalate decarboxylase